MGRYLRSDGPQSPQPEHSSSFMSVFSLETHTLGHYFIHVQQVMTVKVSAGSRPVWQETWVPETNLFCVRGDCHPRLSPTSAVAQASVLRRETEAGLWGPNHWCLDVWLCAPSTSKSQSAQSVSSHCCPESGNKVPEPSKDARGQKSMDLQAKSRKPLLDDWEVRVCSWRKICLRPLSSRE